MVHTFHINDSNSKAKALMDYLRTLEFVKEVSSDWADELPVDAQNEVLEAIDQANKGNMTSHEQMKAKHQKRFPGLKF